MKNYLILIAALLLPALKSCREDDILVDEDSISVEVTDTGDYPDWDDATHSKDAELNYDIVFNQNEVLRFDIEISSDNWSVMQSDLASNYGSSGVGGFGMGGPGGMGGQGGMVADTESSDYDPVWVPCSFKFNDTQWYNVGIRFKGNSSLKSAYQSGNNKLSFKLDFDEFEDECPELKNQRFYGFKQLNLNNNYNDASLMREKVAADLFREFGLASANTAFCVVYLDNGSGPQYYGVYTLVEEVDDTVIDTQFADGSGNLYKPEGNAATFASGTFNTSQMYLKTNEDSANYSDVESLYDIINSSERTNDVESWKSDLESVFDVDRFLKWLAANTVIQNWDTYGNMSHNYFIYNNPENNLLTWIPWDNNEALQYGKQSGSLSLSLEEVGSNWPLISYLINEDEYKDQYQIYLQEFIEQVFVPGDMISRYSKYYELLKDYAYAEVSGYSYIYSDSYFDNAVDELKEHVQTRNDAVVSYLE